MRYIVDNVDKVYIAAGKTDLRRGIDGLASIIKDKFQLDPFQNVLFLFCGSKLTTIKGLLWDGDGFLLLKKQLSDGKFKWPRNAEEMRELSPQQIRWLMEGLSIDTKPGINTLKSPNML
jgi:transposase